MVPDTHAFIIRIWQEADNGNERIALWRGSIQHVGSNKQLYFCDMGSVVRFIQEQIGDQIQRPTPWWRSLLDRIGHEIDTIRTRFNK